MRRHGKIRGIAALALSCCLAAGILGGCSQKDTGNPAGQEPKGGAGKYVEEDVELPLQQGEEPCYLLRRQDGQLELYTSTQEEGIYGRYLSADGKEWEMGDASWLQVEPGHLVTDITAGGDGNDYAVVMDNEARSYLLKETSKGRAEKIALPCLESQGELAEGGYMLFGMGLLVTEDGKLALIGAEEIKVCDPSGTEVLGIFPCGPAGLSGGAIADSRGRHLVTAAEDGQGFTVWDVEKEKEEASVSYGADLGDGRVLLSEDGSLYFLNKEGLHHLTPQGTLVETLAEGSRMTMGDPKTYLEGFVQGNAEDFYALYYGDQALVKHYYFDPNASAGSRRLTVYSLAENDSVRQAVSIFRQSHPDVEVLYKTGASDTSATRADQLRVLNTELLNKNGADVLLLDDLPVDVLVEKGILADLSGILDPLIADGSLRENIAACYRQEDGSIYSMPIRYGIPLLYGSQERLDAMESLDSLERWLDSHGETYMAGLSYEELTQLFLKLYGEELFDQEGGLSREALAQCLSCIKKIGERDEAPMENEYLEEFGSYGGVMAGAYVVDSQEELLAYSEVKGIFDMMIPFQKIREDGEPAAYGRESFFPHGVAGINRAAKEPKLAEEFLKVLFSQELQGYDLADGLPVNPKAEEAFLLQARDSLEEEGVYGGATVSIAGDQEGEINSENSEEFFSFSTPLKSEVSELFDKARGLKKSSTPDCVLQDMVMEEAAGYYEGSRELEEAVQGIAAKADTYQAEQQ